MMKRTLTAAALAVVLAAPAYAQTVKPDMKAKSDTAAENSMPSTKSDTMGKPDTMAKPDKATESSMPAVKSDSATAASTMTNEDAFVTAQHATDWRGSKLIGASIYGPDNSSIGEVNDLILANDGNVNAVVIGVGGFLGVGEKNVAVPFQKLSITRKPDSSTIDKITVSYTKDELKNAPKFVYYDPKNTETTGSGMSDNKTKSLNPNGSKK